MGSENCAASAAGRTKVTLELLLEDGAPREDSAEDVVVLRIVGGSHNMTFLATAHVDVGQGLVSNNGGIFVAIGVHGVDAGHGDSLLGGGLGQLHGGRTSGVADHGSDATRIVGVALLVEGHTDQLVRSNALVKISVNLRGELVPILVTTGQSSAEGSLGARAASVPDGLVAALTDVLGSARNGEDGGHATVVREVVSVLKLLLP